MQMFHNAEFLKCEFSQSDTGQLSVQYYLRHAQEEPEMYPPHSCHNYKLSQVGSHPCTDQTRSRAYVCSGWNRLMLSVVTLNLVSVIYSDPCTA